MVEVDDAIRAENGVVVCLRNLGNGRSRLIFDDVMGDSASNPITWSFENVFTWVDYSDKDLDLTKLTESEYQMIGVNIVTRLLALNGRIT